MHGRKIAALSLLLALLGGMALFVQRPGRRSEPPESAAVFPGLEGSTVGKISFEGPEGPLTLSRGEGDRWYVGDERREADGEAVSRLLGDLEGLRQQAVASTNPDKGGLFGLGEGEVVEVVLEGAGGQVLHEFSVGSPGPDLFSGHLRRKGEENVLLVSANLRAAFGRPLSGWRETRIVRVEAGDVVSVEIDTAEGSVMLAKVEGGWEANGLPADPQAVEEYLRRLTSLRASEFAGEDERAAAGLEEPFAEVRFTAGEEAVALSVGSLREEQNQRYLAVTGSDALFLASRFVAEELAGSAADFPPPPAAEGEETEPQLP